MSCSEGNPPAVTSEANVNVQYDSMLLVGAAMVDSLLVGSQPNAICAKDWLKQLTKVTKQSGHETAARRRSRARSNGDRLSQIRELKKK